MMTYKGYTTGPIDFDPEDSVFSSTVAGLRDVIHSAERTVMEPEKFFRNRIDNHLALCAERGEAQDRPFNGKILPCTAPELQRRAIRSMIAEGTSLTRWSSRQIDLAYGIRRVASFDASTGSAPCAGLAHASRATSCHSAERAQSMESTHV